MTRTHFSRSERGGAQTIITIVVAIAALFILVVFFGPEKEAVEVEVPTTADLQKAPGRPDRRPAESQNANAPTGLQQEVATAAKPLKMPPALMQTGDAKNPPADLPEDLKQALKNTKQELPPDMQAQLKAAPPELPEDLRRQLNNQPTELPEDLKKQLTMPPPEMPEDIRKALETPPRQVSIDEVNTPVDSR